jgi:hypothetical protein|tara:strand:+ start:1389 stop:2225 length:837 start_codon:yes stop_codon:yes gene_type:complete
MCLYDHYLENIQTLGYKPVGLGDKKFRSEWIRDNTGNNISHKNKNYGEYTFYYWFWKNILNTIPDNQWIGFSHYRHHWSNQNKIKSDELNLIITKDNFSSYILKNEPIEWRNYDVILGDPMYVNGTYKLSKIIKKGLRILINNFFAFQNKNKNIKLHFDMFHGYGLLDKAIDVLDDSEKNDFRNFVNNNYSFNRENMFICKSKKLMNAYFLSVFSWLERCENVFGFNLKGYGKIRLYTFLAERYISYWFNKYSNPLSWPVFFFDTNINRIDLKNNNKL